MYYGRQEMDAGEVQKEGRECRINIKEGRGKYTRGERMQKNMKRGEGCMGNMNIKRGCKGTVKEERRCREVGIFPTRYLDRGVR